MKKKPSFKEKIKRAFSFLCSSESVPKEESPTKNQIKKRPTIVKRPSRQTLNLDNAFLKISRKNVVEEEFMTNDILNLQLQKHLSRRLQGQTVVLIRGEFGQQTVKRIVYPMYLMTDLKIEKQIKGGQCLQCQKLINLKQGGVDALLYQTLETYSSKINENGVDEITEIDELLKKIHKKIKNIIFLCSRQLNLEEFNHLVLVYSQYYLCEVEKIRMNESLLGYVVYLSDAPQFLKLNQTYFKTFLSEELDAGQMSKEEISSVIDFLLEKKFYKEILYTIRNIKRRKVRKQDFYHMFLTTICERYPKTKEFLAPYLKKEEEEEEKIVHETPLFGKDVPEFGVRNEQQQKVFDNSRLTFF